MLLRVVYQDGKYDFVNESVLTPLIESGDIAMFERSEGWVHINSPQVRKTGSQSYHFGPERRLHSEILPESIPTTFS